ncbi:MAG: hypothetical protein IJZ08_00045 [Clostridia bacterium]|nr:hypothetical protein [Clostridia bacterium]
MEIRIFTRELILADVYDGAEVIEAEECFDGAGTFSLTVPIADADRFSVEGIVYLPAADGAYVIERIVTDADEMTAEIGGRSVLSYFERCALPESAVVHGTAEEVLLSLVRTHGIKVLGAPLLTVGAGRQETVNAILGGTTLLSAMRTVCAESGLGMRLSVTEGTFVFTVSGRTGSEEILSRSCGDLFGGDARTDVKNYVNRVIVASSGGVRVTVDAAGLFSDGIDDGAYPLHERYHYAQDITPDRYDTEQAHLAALFAEGKRYLARRRPIRTVTVSLAPARAASLEIGTEASVEDTLLGFSGQAYLSRKKIRVSSTGTEYGAEMTLL